MNSKALPSDVELLSRLEAQEKKRKQPLPSDMELLLKLGPGAVGGGGGVCVCVCVCVRVWVCVFVCMYVRVYVCVCVEGVKRYIIQQQTTHWYTSYLGVFHRHLTAPVRAARNSL